MKKKHMARGTGALVLVTGLAMSAIGNQAHAALSGQALVNSKCTVCHETKTDHHLTRIGESRRTPEGWDMTVARMTFAHGVKLTSEERGAVVKYLSDTYGLAPDETADHRYIVERTPSVVEHPESKPVGDTCARCHSYGRIAVQRRTEDDWRKLVHFHVGQFPAIEIQAGGRDRNWFEIATGEVSKELGKLYGYETESWKQWKARKHADASGVWRLVGNRPGVGAYEGSATITKTGDDRYSVDMVMRYENGSEESAKGSAIVYTGHEWRATLKQGGRDIHQVFSLGSNGVELSGRWFESNNDAVGGTLRAVRADKGAPASVLSVQPAMVRAGTRTTLAINGVGLNGEVDLGRGVKVIKLIEQSAERIVAEVEVAKDVASSSRDVQVGRTSGAGLLKLYTQIDYVKVLPQHPMARVGGNGGSQPKVPAQLEAIAWAAGPDGKPGTADDIRLGAVPAAWSVDNLNKMAVEMQDTKFAGRIEQTGLFVPNGAGPNPERKYKTNNAGELKVTATVKDGSRMVKASAPLIVTVQRFNDPPIR
jgi:quinohemoprotein amine dehydrogenase